jgi:hypothetical protein
VTVRRNGGGLRLLAAVLVGSLDWGARLDDATGTAAAAGAAGAGTEARTGARAGCTDAIAGAGSISAMGASVDASINEAEEASAFVDEEPEDDDSKKAWDKENARCTLS